MDNMLNSSPAGESMPWYDVWMEVITHPSRESFRTILADPKSSPARAFIWVAILGAIFGVAQAVVIQVFGSSLYQDLPDIGLAPFVLCLAIATPIFSVIGLAINAAIYHGISLLLKGEGKYGDLVYTLGAIQAPISIVSLLISLITNAVTASAGSAGTPGTLCLVPLSLAIGIYTIVLQVMAIDTVEKFGTGKAVLTVLIPVILGLLLGVCLVATIGLAAFQQFGQ